LNVDLNAENVYFYLLSPELTFTLFISIYTYKKHIHILSIPLDCENTDDLVTFSDVICYCETYSRIE